MNEEERKYYFMRTHLGMSPDEIDNLTINGKTQATSVSLASNKTFKEESKKVFLTMDDPMFCGNCPLARERKFKGGYVCAIGHNEKYGGWVYEPVDMDSETKPDWCPLKPSVISISK